MLRRRLTYANVASTLALVLALGGVGYAATILPARSVGTVQLKNGAVTSPKLAGGAVTTKKVHDSSLRLRDLGGRVNHATSTLGSTLNVPAWGCGGESLDLFIPTPAHLVGSLVIGYITDAQGHAAMDNDGIVVPTIISATSQGGALANLVICTRAGSAESVPAGSVFHYRVIGP